MKKKFFKKLTLSKATIANLDNLTMKFIKGKGCATDPAPTCVSEYPDCDTLSDCNVTVGKPYLCPTIPPYPNC